MSYPATSGVDTIAVSVPIFRAWKKLSLPNGGRISAYGDTASIELSVPKRAWGNNISFATPDTVFSELRGALAEARECVRYRAGENIMLEQLHVTRLDVGVNFTAAVDVSDVIWSIGHHSLGLDRRWHKVLYVNDEPRRGETVRIGPRRAWHVSLYDKERESRDPRARGIVRFEAMLRHERLTGAWARRNGSAVGQLGDLAPAKLDSLAERSFEAVRLGQRIPHWLLPDREYVLDWSGRVARLRDAVPV